MTRTRGLTMLEALLALAVLGVLLATVASLQASNLTVTRAAAADGERLEVARAVFETTARRVEDDFEAYRTCAGGRAPAARAGRATGSGTPSPSTATWSRAGSGVGTSRRGAWSAST